MFASRSFASRSPRAHGVVRAQLLMAAPALLAALGWATGCTVTRDTPTLSCTSSIHCPADGTWVCDTSVGQCVSKAGSDASVDASSDATATSDSGSASTGSDVSAGDVLSTGGDAAADAIVDPDTAASDTASGSTSCVDRCDEEYDGSNVCHCDAFCASSGDCCEDYAAICGEDSDASADTSLASDTTSTTDAG